MLFKVCVEVPEQGHSGGASPPPEVEKLRQAEERLEGYRRATTALREALEAKGASLGEGTPLEDYATAVESLPDPLPPIKIVGDLRLNSRRGQSGGFWGLSGMQVCPPVDTSEARSVYCLFYQCAMLRALPSPLDLSSATEMDNMMAYSGVEEADIYAPVATNAKGIAHECKSLRRLSLNLPECGSLLGAFKGCTSLQELHITGLKCSIDLLGTAVGVDSVGYIVEHAQQALDGAVLTLPRAMEAKLDEETMETAISKGFDVTFR